MWYQRSLLKYADDMALVAWMSDEQSLVTYMQFVDPMVLQFLETLLQVNISKTEELCWGGAGSGPGWDLVIFGHWDW